MKIPSPRAGVTLTELLVVLVIISILATIALPVYIGHSENARIHAAQLECKELGDAEDACAAIHGFYVPLQLLNDLAGGNKVPEKTAPNSLNAIGNESDILLVDPFLNWLNLTTQINIDSYSTDPRLFDMVENWQGPFMSFQRTLVPPKDPLNPNSQISVQLDHPLDPWRQPYRFYTPRGIIGPLDNSNSNSLAFASSLAQGAISGTPRFDRYAIVSFGPDNTPNENDIIYLFGKVNVDVVTETGF